MIAKEKMKELIEVQPDDASYEEILQKLASAELIVHDRQGRIVSDVTRKTVVEEPLTAIFEKSPYGYIAYVEELAGANTQGATLEEARSNLLEAVQLVLAANRELAEDELRGKEHIRRPLGTITA